MMVQTCLQVPGASLCAGVVVDIPVVIGVEPAFFANSQYGVGLKTSLLNADNFPCFCYFNCSIETVEILNL